VPRRLALLPSVLAVAAVACAAGPGRRHPTAPAPAASADDAAAPLPSGPGVAALPSLDELAARGASAIARMREVRRLPDVASLPVALEPPTTDACFRAVVATSAPVRARFEDAAHVARGEPAAPGLAWRLVPPRGPVCARRGERLFFAVEALADAGPSAARAVLFQSP
jgi:hypothetical protein